jgi:hypothetical protein
MIRTATPQHRRWALSLVDVSLLLLCCLLAGGVSHRVPKPAPFAQLVPGAIFIAGEARMHQEAAAQLRAMARTIPASTQISIETPITPTAHDRLDPWELAAARTAALGRFLQAERPSAPPPILHAPAQTDAQAGAQSGARILIAPARPAISDAVHLAQSLPVTEQKD